MRGIWVACALVTSACFAGRSTPPAPPREPKLGLTISTATLPNGLRTVLVNDPHAIDVQVTMQYQVGAVEDGAHSGMAHFVEHLMFQQVLDGEPLFTHLEDVATYFNAYTTHDLTTYVARARLEHLDKLLAIEAARLSLPCETITDAAFARERDVVINEIKERDQVTEVLGAVHGALYPQHPYRQSIGGTEQSVGTITRQAACSFANAYYAPSNAVLVISGNLGQGAQDSLNAFASRIPARAAAARATLPPVGSRAGTSSVEAAVDQDVLLFAWPLPAEPELQAKIRAVAAALPRLVDAKIKGRVVAVELGDQRAPMFGLAVVHADDETFYEASAGAWQGIGELPNVFAPTDQVEGALFERVRQAAIYGLYSSLEDGSDRDLRLAGMAFGGRDPNRAIAAELEMLRNLTLEQGSHIAYRYLSIQAATVVTIRARAGKKRGQSLALRKPIHDMGQRRTPPDPALATKPATALPAAQLSTSKARVLPNGLKVVLLPVSSVPTVDIRLVFRVGSADEPVTQRGLATLTAHALTWDLHHVNDLIAFAAAGGMKSTDVGVDRTTFSVQGIDSQFHVLLSGLRRWVRDGTFDDDSAKTLLEMRRATKRIDDEGALTDTWRAAVFGSTHPYVRAGIARHANSSLTLDDAAQFRVHHYAPGNATLVVAGRFDAALVDRWIDYLFADWSGASAARAGAVAAPEPASIAMVEDVEMLQLRIAIAAKASSRAAQLVAAEMLSEIARDVRYQLGASYALDAALAEQRLARNYVIGGWIDANRATKAIELIRDRIKRLKTDSEAAARAFVIARQHVVAQLMARVSSAGSLAARVEQDIALERAPMSDLETASAVRALTIEQMSTALPELDLSRAVILMRGPASELKGAFGALGRKPSYVEPVATDTVATAAPGANPPVAPIGTTAGGVLRTDVQPALTEQAPPPYAFAVGLNASRGAVNLTSTYYTSGYTLSGLYGYRFSRRRSIGVRGALGLFDGEFRTNETITVMPLDLGAYINFVGKSRLWSMASVGLRAEYITTPSAKGWAGGVGYCFEVGADVARFGLNNIAIALGIDGMSFRTSDTGSVTLTLGLQFRR